MVPANHGRRPDPHRQSRQGRLEAFGANVTTIAHAAYSRQNPPERLRRLFVPYVDEFYSSHRSTRRHAFAVEEVPVGPDADNAVRRPTRPVDPGGGFWECGDDPRGSGWAPTTRRARAAVRRGRVLAARPSEPNGDQEHDRRPAAQTVFGKNPAGAGKGGLARCASEPGNSVRQRMEWERWICANRPSEYSTRSSLANYILATFGRLSGQRRTRNPLI